MTIEIPPGCEPILERARAEAARLGHPYIGTEHILLALLSSDDPDVAEALKAASTSHEQVRRSLEQALMPGHSRMPGRDNHFPLTSRARTVLQLVSESNAADSPSIKILRGFKQEGKNIAVAILAQHGVEV